MNKRIGEVKTCEYCYLEFWHEQGLVKCGKCKRVYEEFGFNYNNELGMAPAKSLFCIFRDSINAIEKIKVVNDKIAAYRLKSIGRDQHWDLKTTPWRIESIDPNGITSTETPICPCGKCRKKQGEVIHQIIENLKKPRKIEF